ncbi:hypothetical protein BT96DRAFT_1007260 [Gymnopus androsaceus JB14]|uniref:Uncharacterized protein n=1 Tax=Gymnopus androsaceus JB14 TaxID=1447944 RepID=A0A6A4GHT8_9AGAR|nr:hypothetical protein BT96DRAFT_1007260 [Gymnopus androsaceus JB14]
MAIQTYFTAACIFEKWLQYLENIHPSFQSGRVTIDWEAVQQLPVSQSVYAQLHHVEVEEIPDNPMQDGPPQGNNDHASADPLYSRGFVPNPINCETEMDQLRAAASEGQEPVILTMPAMHGAPLNEHAGLSIDIDAFPSLFPSGKVDFNASRDTKVTMQEWAAHLL